MSAIRKISLSFAALFIGFSAMFLTAGTASADTGWNAAPQCDTGWNCPGN